MEKQEYGYMEDGYLHSRLLYEETEVVKDKDGTTHTRVVTIEEQAKSLSGEWKPVDRIDENSMRSDDPDNIVVAMPYDAGDHIAYRYETKFDTQKKLREIQSLKDELAASDYKVLKCMEATMAGAEMPYDAKTIVDEREAIRDKINELEAKVEDTTATVRPMP